MRSIGRSIGRRRQALRRQRRTPQGQNQVSAARANPPGIAPAKGASPDAPNALRRSSRHNRYIPRAAIPGAAIPGAAIPGPLSPGPPGETPPGLATKTRACDKDRGWRGIGRPGGHSEGQNTRSHSELGRENPQRRWYCVSRRGRVGRRQALQCLAPASSTGHPQQGILNRRRRPRPRPRTRREPAPTHLPARGGAAR